MVWWTEQFLKEHGFVRTGDGQTGTGIWEKDVDPPTPPGEYANGAIFLVVKDKMSLCACDGGDGGCVVSEIKSKEGFLALDAAIKLANGLTR